MFFLLLLSGVLLY